MTPIEWGKRAKVRRTAISKQRRIESTSHPWALIEVRGLYGHYWLTVRRMPEGEYVASKHRKRSAAEQACLSR